MFFTCINHSYIYIYIHHISAWSHVHRVDLHPDVLVTHPERKGKRQQRGRRDVSQRPRRVESYLRKEGEDGDTVMQVPGGTVQYLLKKTDALSTWVPYMGIRCTRSHSPRPFTPVPPSSIERFPNGSTPGIRGFG